MNRAHGQTWTFLDSFFWIASYHTTPALQGSVCNSQIKRNGPIDLARYRAGVADVGPILNQCFKVVCYWLYVHCLPHCDTGHVVLQHIDRDVHTALYVTVTSPKDSDLQELLKSYFCFTVSKIKLYYLPS